MNLSYGKRANVAAMSQQVHAFSHQTIMVIAQ